MTDLAQDKDMGRAIHLYDIGYDAAKKNETIGNSIEIGDWSYRALLKELSEKVRYIFTPCISVENTCFFTSLCFL